MNSRKKNNVIYLDKHSGMKKENKMKLANLTAIVGLAIKGSNVSTPMRKVQGWFNKNNFTIFHYVSDDMSQIGLMVDIEILSVIYHIKVSFNINESDKIIFEVSVYDKWSKTQDWIRERLRIERENQHKNKGYEMIFRKLDGCYGVGCRSEIPISGLYKMPAWKIVSNYIYEMIWYININDLDEWDLAHADGDLGKPVVPLYQDQSNARKSRYNRYWDDDNDDEF